MWLLAFLGCANNIKALYEQEKAAALAPPAPLSADWKPELRVRLSDPALETLADAALKTGLLAAEDKITFEGPLGVTAELSPQLSVKSLKLGAAEGCEACLDLVATLEGRGPWKIGKLKGEIPIALELDGTLAFEAKKENGSFLVSGRLKDLRHVKVKTDLVGDVDLAKPLQGWAKDLAEGVPPFELGEFGGEGVPIRALRLATSGGVLAVEAVTDVAGGGSLAGKPAKLTEGWELAISQKTALALMRREAFEAGIISYEVAADPRYLEVNGSVFTMGVRLWRLTSRGWWRDYEVSGQIEVLPRSVRLVPKSSVEGDKSKGAGLVDPIALLAEGAILDTVEDGIAQTLPSGEKTGVGEQELSLRATSVRGADGALLIVGGLSLGAPAPEEASEGGGGGGKKKGERRQQRRRAQED